MSDALNGFACFFGSVLTVPDVAFFVLVPAFLTAFLATPATTFAFCFGLCFGLCLGVCFLVFCFTALFAVSLTT